jgi:hypothetical protein
MQLKKKHILFECPIQVFHSKFSVTDEKEGLWEDPTDAGKRP